MTQRVLFVGRSRYRLPLEPSIARKWDALGAELDLRVLASAADEGERGDAVFRLVPPAGPASFYLSLPFRVARELREFRPDVVVTQSPYEAAAALAACGAVRSRARVLLEVHGDWQTATRLYGSPLRRLAEPVSERLAEEAVRRAHAVRTVSPFTTGLVRRLGVEPAATFTTFFDAEAFRAHPPAPLPARPAALCVGVLERYKNVAGLAAAWRIAAPQLPEAVLRIVGRGRETKVVERLVADLPGQASWTPWLSPAEVAAALDEASLLVLPSLSEGLPRVAMEAFCRGRPVVGSRAGGIPDVVEDGVSGLLVPPGDPHALAAALVRSLGDGALLGRLAAGARESAARWVQTPEQFAARMRALVEAVR